MSKHRRAARVDNNQTEIVKELRKIPGLSVQLDMDDLLIGYQGKTYWYECKTSPTAKVKDSQYQISKEWTGHYRFAFSARDILQDIGIERIKADRAVFNAVWHGIIKTGLTPARANKYALEAMDRYKAQDFNDTPTQLITTMIEEAQQ